MRIEHVLHFLLVGVPECLEGYAPNLGHRFRRVGGEMRLELLEDLVKAAVGAATAKSKEAMKTEMAALTGGLNIPGITEMLGGS